MNRPYSQEIYGRLEAIFGRDWAGRQQARICRTGCADIHLFNLGDDTYSLATHCDYKGMPLADPEIIFEADHVAREIKVISQEDYFHHAGPEPRRRFRTAQDDPESAGDLHRYLHDWLVAIQRSQARR